MSEPSVSGDDPVAGTVKQDEPKKGWLRRLFGGGSAPELSKETAPSEETASSEDARPVAPSPEEEGLAGVPVQDGPKGDPDSDPDLGADAMPAPESVAEVDPSGMSTEEPDIVPVGNLATVETGPASATGGEDAPVSKKSWFQRLRDGLSRSSSRLTTGISDLFTKRKLDDEALEDLEELLITADLGVATASKLTQALAKSRFGKDVTAEEVRTALAEEATRLLTPVAQPLVLDRTRKPHVILVVGVNGAGKTTTIGKMARQFQEQGLKVSLAAGDTFRAAAVEQLKVWGERTGCPVIARETGADAAGLAYDALQASIDRQDDVLMIDTAGRLHNKGVLMEELRKIRRVIQKLDPTAPHTTLLVLDATVGQNAHQQVEVFKDMVDVTGLVMTKLDGTAKGGVVVALAERFGLPVHYIGVGETAEDLQPFAAEDFARSLMGLS